MFDDILGPRQEKIRYHGEKRKVDPMDNQKPIPPSVGGVKGRPVPISTGTPLNSNRAKKQTDPWEEDIELEEECEDDCGCCDDCSGDPIGCFDECKDDEWSV